MQSVVVNGITKAYGKGQLPAVDHISFAVDKGEVFGLIGPDGAGKTTLFRILTTLLLPDSGTASVDGFDVVADYRKIRNTVGYMPGRFSLYPDLSVEENLAFFATVFNTTVKENDHLIRDIYVQLEPFRRRRAGKLSGGMKQKLALCCALIHKPAVLFLDEPTTGVDPVSRKEFWAMLGRLKEQGITIIVSTPYMDEAVLCDRIALLQAGSILAMDTPAGISASYPHALYAVRGAGTPALLQALSRDARLQGSYAFGEAVHVAVKRDTAATDDENEAGIKAYLEKEGFKNITVNRISPEIEDCFIGLATGSAPASG